MSDDQTAIERIDLYDSRSAAQQQVPNGASIVPRRYWIENLFHNTPTSQYYHYTFTRDERRASANDAMRRMQPHSVRVPMDVLTGVDSEMSIPAPNPRAKLPNPRGAR